MLVTDTDIYHSDALLQLLKGNEQRLNLRKTTLAKNHTVMRQGDRIDDILFISSRFAYDNRPSCA